MNETRSTSAFKVGALLGDPKMRILVCCGSGGVGKTTTAAALALHAAEQGRRVCVLTIDPARRLAQSIGLSELDNTPRQIPGVGAEAGGALYAMMLDMKRTFDEIVEQHADPDRAEQILANSFYQTLSSSFAGTQEYMAMEKLGQLAREAEQTHEWDLIVVDTPPSRSALDFLDAPERLGSFLDGRFIRFLMAPARVGGRAYMKVVGAGFSIVSGCHDKDSWRPATQRLADTGQLDWTRSSAAFANVLSRPTRCCRHPERRSSSSPLPRPTRCGRRRTSWSGCSQTRCPSVDSSSTEFTRRSPTDLSAERAAGAAEDLHEQKGTPSPPPCSPCMPTR